MATAELVMESNGGYLVEGKGRNRARKARQHAGTVNDLEHVEAPSVRFLGHPGASLACSRGPNDDRRPTKAPPTG
jgi:hypothetical protein